MILMRAPDGFGHDFVDDAHREQVGGRDLQRLGRFHLACRITPQDRGAALRGNHAVHGELLHQHPVADRDPERAAGTTLAADDHHDGCIKQRHFAQVQRDGFRHAALLGFHTGVGRRRIDKHNHRPSKLGGQLHHPQRLAIPLRFRVAEVPVNLLLGVAALLVPDDKDRLAVEVRHAGDDGLVIGESSVAVQLGKPLEQAAHVVEHDRTVGVTGHQHALPRREVREQLCAQLLHARLQPRDDGGAVRRRRHQAKCLNFLQQDRDRLFKFECIDSHLSPPI